MENEVHCTLCHRGVEEGALVDFNGEHLCPDCLEEHTVVCRHCGTRVWDEDSHSDGNTCICNSCYNEHYYRCTSCDQLIRQDESYFVDDDDEPMC